MASAIKKVSYPILYCATLFCPVLSRPILSYPILSYPVISYPILSYPIPSHPIPSHPIPSLPIPSHPIPSHPIPSHPIPSHPILSYPILFCSVLSILSINLPAEINPSHSACAIFPAPMNPTFIVVATQMTLVANENEDTRLWRRVTSCDGVIDRASRHVDVW